MQEELGFCVVEKARDDIAVDEALFAPVQAAAENAARLEGIEAYEAYIVLADDDFLHELNRQYRDVDRSTDVLSFPENELDEPLRKALDEGYCPEMDVEGKRIALGDIYISVEQAARQGAEYGNTLEEELCFLAVHGMLHLMGYDHMQEDEEAVMRRKQREALGRK